MVKIQSLRMMGSRNLDVFSCVCVRFGKMKTGEREQAMEEEMMFHRLVQDEGLTDLESGDRGGIYCVHCFHKPMDNQINVLKVER